jgi:hypothetical protein
VTQLLGTITSLNASLTVAVFDARSADAWVPTKAAENKAQFTGHPAEILRGLGKGEELTPIDVGPSGGVAFELEGASGQLDAYRVANGLALVAPGRAWWRDEDVDALFAELLGGEEDATELEHLEIESGRLAVVYVWLRQVAQAKELAVPGGGAASFGDRDGASSGGLVIDLAPGRYSVRRHEIDAPDGRGLVAMFFVRA